MRSIPRVLIERVLVLVLIVSVTLPLLTAAWLRLSHNESPRTAWLRNVSLSGTQYQPENVRLTRSSCLSSEYQTAFAHDYDHTYAARELVIRVINELYLRLFHTSGGVVIGRHNTLFDQVYLDEYSLERTGPDTFEGQVADLRRLQDFCEARGIAFAFLITPSKASVYPEEIPPSYERRFKPGLRRYDSLLPLLKKAGIHVINGHEIAMSLKPKVKLPLYPLGGIHWTDPTALAVANALTELLASEGLPVKPITRFDKRITDHPRDGRDRDLADFLNAVTRFNYPVTEIDPQPEPRTGRYHPNIVFMGGSFSWKVLTLLDATRQFSELDFLYYYTQNKHVEVDDKVYLLAEPTRPVDFQREVFAADAIVIEANEQAMYVPNHVSRFLRDAVAAMPDPHAPKAPYKYEALDSYRWGDTISFVAGKNPPRFGGGFTPSGDNGAYTDGARATLRLAAAPATQDMELQVTATPFLFAPQIPNQKISVYVNDHPVGEMVWREVGFSLRKLMVPKEYLSEDRTLVEFQFDHPLSPAEVGLNADTRKLGICVSTIRFAPIGDGPQTEGAGFYHWGETISFEKSKNPIAPEQVSGFTERGDEGSFTVGPSATIRLTTPPAQRDMILSVEAKAFLIEGRLPQQDVDVLINSHPVGHWEWRFGTPFLHELTVPREYLHGGDTELEFRISRPSAPADFGLNGDTRKLGILISKLRLHEPDK